MIGLMREGSGPGREEDREKRYRRREVFNGTEMARCRALACVHTGRSREIKERGLLYLF